MKRFAVFVSILLMALVMLPVNAQTASTPADLCEQALPATDPETREFAAPEQVLEPGVDYRAIFCTGAGPIYVDLYEDEAPMTVNSFVFLATNNYYNNINFHRVIDDFMAQGGDPTNTGSGGPGYQFEDEFTGYLLFDRPGLLAMANAGPGTNGSQFFITYGPTEHLNLRHTIFGEVLEGQDNALSIEQRDPASATTPGTELNTVLIITDPETVTTDFVEPESSTPEEILQNLEAVNALLPATAEQTVTNLETADVVSAAPEAIQADYEAYLTENNHQFTIGSEILDCDLSEIPFMTVGYELETYASAADATAAIENTDFIAELRAAQGFTESVEAEEVPNTVYTGTTTMCDTTATMAVTQLQRGRYVANVSVTIPTESQLTPAQWLREVVSLRLYEPILADVLRREIR